MLRKNVYLTIKYKPEKPERYYYTISDNNERQSGVILDTTPLGIINHLIEIFNRYNIIDYKLPSDNITKKEYRKLEEILKTLINVHK